MPDSGYREVEIHIRKQAADGTYPIAMRVPDEDRRADGVFNPPYTDEEVDRALTWMEQGLFDAAYVQELGASLFRALFVGDLGAIYAASRQGRAPLRLRLIADAPSVARIPWELLYDPDRGRFLALEGPVVRGASSTAATRPLSVKPPLRILVVDAFPRGVLKVQSQVETDGIRQALDKLVRRRRIRIETLPHATMRTLQNTLREAADPEDPRPFHVLHFIGHGRYDRDSGRTVLLFEGERGEVDEVDADRLVDVLGPFDLKLIFLNACQSLQSSALDLTRGFAPKLLESGVPAVIGMQVTVLDEVAVQFSRDFYEGLADNRPVDVALADARVHVRGTERRRKADLGIPACYLRTATGQILDIQRPERVPLTRETWRPWLRQRAGPAAAAAVGALLTVATAANLITGQGVGPWLQSVFAGRAPMPASFNVAVAEFSTRSADGRVEPGEKAGLAEKVHVALDGDLKALGGATASEAPFDVDVWTPAQTGRLTGTWWQWWRPKDPARAAQELADAIKADVIVHGILEVDAGVTRLTPQFYLSRRKLVGYADELAGLHEFGGPIPQLGSPENETTRLGLIAGVQARMRPLAHFIRGLDRYTVGRFDEADYYFEQADLSGGWDDPRDKGVLYLFRGNTAGKLAAGGSGSFERARDFYARVPQGDRAYARAQLGLAEILFQTSGAAGGCQVGNVDLARLREAADTFSRGKQSAIQSGPAIVGTRAAYSLGRVHLCLALAVRDAEHRVDPRELANARIEFGVVVADRARLDASASPGQREVLQDLAAEARGQLALTFLVGDESNDQDPYHSALREFDEAIHLTRHNDRKASYHVWKAHIYLDLDKCPEADQALKSAATAYDDAIKRDKKPPDQRHEKWHEQVETRRDRAC
jgi:tetratricopeptide (TPR) repeat protein